MVRFVTFKVSQLDLKRTAAMINYRVQFSWPTADDLVPKIPGTILATFVTSYRQPKPSDRTIKLFAPTPQSENLSKHSNTRFRTFADAMKNPRHPNAFVKIQMHFHIGIISEGANLYSFLMAQQQTRIYRE